MPLVSWVAAKQLMQFAEPSDTLFRTAFQGVDVVHIYMPFKFGRRAAKVAHQMGIPVTAGFHLQPENVLYSAGPLRRIPGISSFLYWLFKHWLYTVSYTHLSSTSAPTPPPNASSSSPRASARPSAPPSCTRWKAT